MAPIYKVATDMQQIWGGHGYIAENGMEQFVRDARIAMIYEGANGFRQWTSSGASSPCTGAGLFRRSRQGMCRVPRRTSGSADLAGRVEKTNGELQAATLWLMNNGLTNPETQGRGPMTTCT